MDEPPFTTFHPNTAAMLGAVQRFLVAARPSVRMPAGYDSFTESRMPSSALAVLRCLTEERIAAGEHELVVPAEKLLTRARLPVSTVERAIAWLDKHGYIREPKWDEGCLLVTVSLSHDWTEARFQQLGPRFQAHYPPGYAGPADMTWKAEAALNGQLWPANIPLNDLYDGSLMILRAIGDSARLVTDRNADAGMPRAESFQVSHQMLAGQFAALPGRDRPPFPPADVFETLIRAGVLGHTQPLGLPLWTAEWQSNAVVTLTLSPVVWMTPMQIRSVAWLGEKLA